MKLKAVAVSAFTIKEQGHDPFEAATGYHRIALDVMTGLVSDSPREVVVNVANHSAIEDLEPEDIVEVPCDIDRTGVRPRRTGRLPDSVRGLVQAVKAYERTAIRAALSHSRALAHLPILEYPLIGQSELATEVLGSLCNNDPKGLGYLR